MCWRGSASRCDLGESEAVGGEVEYRAIGYEQNLLAALAGVLAIEGELLDAGHPFLHRPVGLEHEAAPPPPADLLPPPPRAPPPPPPPAPSGRILRPSVVSMPEKTTLRAPWLI